MDVGPRDAAIETLKSVSYYRLSGYWYSFRRFVGPDRGVEFSPETSLADVLRLYHFDESLRAATFAALGPVELRVRALLGHALGEIDECAHLHPRFLGPEASKGDSYRRWRIGYEKELARSREEFVDHHKTRYGGTLPVWVAVEVLDWGALSFLYGFSPRPAQDRVSGAFGLTSPQLRSWLRALNIVRNVCAHHGRLFNRVHAITPKLPVRGAFPDLDHASQHMNRTFGQLALVQHMLREQGSARVHLLPSALRAYPDVSLVPLAHLGAPDDWSDQAMWKPTY
jgi:abortive infection bacteriophage resistance protein